MVGLGQRARHTGRTQRTVPNRVSIELFTKLSGILPHNANFFSVRLDVMHVYWTSIGFLPRFTRWGFSVGDAKGWFSMEYKICLQAFYTVDRFFFFWLRGRGRVLIFFLYSRSGDVSCWSHFPFFVANGPAFQRRRAHRPNGESRENPLGRRWDWRSPTRCLSRCYHRRTLSSEVPWTGLCQGVHEAFLGSPALSWGGGGGHECLESLVTLGIFNRTTGRARARVRFRKRRRHHCSRTPPFGCLMNLLEKKMIPFHFYLVGPFESIIGSFNLICYLQ